MAGLQGDAEARGMPGSSGRNKPQPVKYRPPTPSPHPSSIGIIHDTILVCSRRAAARLSPTPRPAGTDGRREGGLASIQPSRRCRKFVAGWTTGVGEGRAACGSVVGDAPGRLHRVTVGLYDV